MKKLLVLLAALLITVATATASDYFDATGIPVARSTISSAEFRTEFTSIETGISDKLPPLTGNGDNWVVVNSGGTALTSITNAAAQTLLSVAVGTDVQAWDDDLDDISALAKTDGSIMVGDGTDWVLEAPATARTSLGLAIGTNVQAYDADLTTWAGITPSANIQSFNAAATYAAARALMDLEVGTDFNAYDADLTTWAGITPSANVQSLNAAANYAAINALLSTEVGTDFNAYDADLTTYAGITPSANIQTFLGAANYAAMITQLSLTVGSDVQAHAVVLDNTTASFLIADESHLDAIEALADVTDAANVAAAGAPIISSGAGAPGSTPSAEGDIYVDTTADYSYVAACTTSSACWKQATGLGGGDLLAANNLSDVALASTARTNLGLAIGTNVQAYDADLTTWAGITPSANIQSLNAAATYAAARALLDVESGTDFYSIAGANAAFEGIDATILKDADIGGSVQAYDADLTTLAGLSSADSNFIVGSAAGFVVESGATARTSIGAQASDADLTAIAALAKTNNNMMVANGSAWALETPAQVRASLDLEAGTDLHAYDADLNTIAGLAKTDGAIMVGNGTIWVLESGDTVRTSLGLAIGTNVQAYDSVLANTTASYTTALNTKLGNIETAADVTDATNVAAAGAPIISSGAGAPASTPSADGDIYVDTTADYSYVAACTTSAACWKQATGLGGGDLLAANNLSDVAVAATALSNIGGQPVDANLTDLAALSAVEGAGAFMVSTGVGAWAHQVGASARTSMGVAIGSDVQAHSAVLDANTASYTTALNTKLGNIETAADVTDATNVAAAGAPIISSGAGAPGSTPSVDGDIYVDTTNDYTYIAACTTSSACWKQSTGLGGGDLVSTNNLSDVAVAATALSNIGGQPVDADLTTIGGFAKTDGAMMIGNGTIWTLESAGTLHTSMGLGIGADVQAYDADLTTWAGVSPTANGQSLVSSTNYASMRGLLDLEAGTDFNAYDADLTTYAGITPAANTQSLLAAANYAAMKTLLNLTISTNVQAYDADLTELAALSDADSNFIVGSAAGWVAENPATARTSMGAQASDTDLTAIAALAKTNNNMMVANGSAWALETPAQVRASLDLEGGTDFNVYDTELNEIANLANTDGNIIVGTGTVWTAENGATARTSLGVGTASSPHFTGVNVGHATDSTITRAAAGEIELEGRPMIVHDNGAYVGGRIIVTATTPTNTTGMDSGDMKFVY